MATQTTKSLSEVRDLRKRYTVGIFIEPQKGETYNTNQFAVYGYYPYPNNSVLYGSDARCFLKGGYDSIEDAQKDWPSVEDSDCRHIPFDQVMPKGIRPEHLKDMDEPYDEDDY